MPPTSVNGKICYVEIPAEDVSRSSAFYAAVFGWEIRRRGDGATAFHDGVEVSGAWVKGRPPSREAGLLLYVMVADIACVLEKVKANGGEIVRSVQAGAPEVIATFKDPAGNLIGLYQDQVLASGGRRET